MTAIATRATPIPATTDATQLPDVQQVIDDATFDVSLDVSQHIDWLALANVLSSAKRDLAGEWFVLLHNRTDSPRRRMAAAVLMSDPAIRMALTIRLDPADAEKLGLALDQASTSPERCNHPDGRCNNFVEDDRDTLCPPHAAEADGD